jgi:hypothetical protein
MATAHGSVTDVALPDHPKITSTYSRTHTRNDTNMERNLKREASTNNQGHS